MIIFLHKNYADIIFYLKYNIEVTREFLLDRENKRKKIEEGIMGIVNFLNSDGIPGLDGNLIDNQGFPLPNIDHIAVRTASNKLIYLQIDLKILMEIIEKNMAIFFNNQKLVNKVEVKEEKIDLKEPIQLQVFEDNNYPKKNKEKIRIPFATVGLVSDGSPAEEAGLKVGDGIINFDDTVCYGAFSNPLQKLAEIVGRKKGIINPDEVVRKVNDQEGNEKTEYISINLVQHTLEGQGLLG